MGKLKDVSPKKKGQIQALLAETTYSHRKITKTLGVSRSTVDRVALIVSSGEKNPTFTPKRVGNCGRKRITSQRTDRIIQKKLLQNRRLPIENIRNQLEDEKIDVSSRTLRRRASEFGLKSCRPRRKPKLTSKMIEKRLKWAKKYSAFTEEDWKSVSYYFTSYFGSNLINFGFLDFSIFGIMFIFFSNGLIFRCTGMFQ